MEVLNTKTRIVRRRLFTVLGLLLPLISFADDVGLITAKLTEQDGYRYVLEADVTPQLRNTLFEPILPQGFTRLKTELTVQGALINVRYPFVGDRPLEAGDELVLPWDRSGVLLHAKWADGSKGSDLFMRTTMGIAIELNRIKHLTPTRTEQVRTCFMDGLNRMAGNWTLWIPALAMALLFSPRRAVRYLWIVAGGLAAALLIPDFYPVHIPSVIAGTLILAAVIMAARLPAEPLAPVFLIAAATLGLSGNPDFEPVSRTAFALGILLFYSVACGLLIAGWKGLKKKPSQKGVALLLGGLAVAGILQTLTTQPPEEKTAPKLSALQPATPAKSAANAAARKLTDPFLAFLSIEPYEVRFEIMASGRAITQLLELPLARPDLISIEEQPILKQQAVEALEKMFTLSFDGKPVSPSLRRGDFLTLGNAGAFTRTQEVPEPLDDAIVGLTFAYIRPGPPQTMNLSWKKLPAQLAALPATVIEPDGNRGFTFSSDQLSLDWKNESDGLQPVEISVVDVVRPGWAPLTLLLLLVALVKHGKRSVSYTCIALSLLAYPVVRIPLPFGAPLRPAHVEPIVQQLLTNVYRSFDFRQESAIYDQLAVSVTGDQLTEIYLGQRRALELENRGGARARVETVDVQSVDNVQATQEGMDVTAHWNVSGSVNHFGHTHYRQNAYHATLQLIPVEGVWKIIGIGVYEEKRIY